MSKEFQFNVRVNKEQVDIDIATKKLKLRSKYNGVFW